MAQDDLQARWEQRSASRVVGAGRDQILRRSRKLVEAAYELLDSEGLEGLTIRAVLKRSGLSRRAFYERFADKDELVLAVFEETIRMAARLYGEEVKGVPDPLERLKRIITNIVLAKSSSKEKAAPKTNRRGAAMSREHLRLAQSHPHDLQGALAPLMVLIAEQLAQGMAAGVVRTADPQLLATLVYNLVSTTIHTELLAHEGDSPNRARRARLAAEIWEFCRRAIAA